MLAYIIALGLGATAAATYLYVECNMYDNQEACDTLDLVLSWDYVIGA